MDKWFNNNNIAKVIALCISIILWAMVHLDSTTTVAPVTPQVSTKTIDNLKIQIANFDEDKYVLYGLEPDKVRLEVAGKRTSITSVFSDDNYKVKLDLKNVTPGTKTLPLITEVPSGVDVVALTPSYVKVTIEAKASKTFEANVVTTGEPSEGLQIGTPVLKDGGKVKVTLPESEIGEVQKVQATLDVSGIDGSIKGKSVKLAAYDKAGQIMKNAEISPDTVEVDVPVIKLYKSVPVTIQTTGKLPEGYALSDVESSVEQVVVYGPKETLDTITSYPITVDLGKLQGQKESVFTVDLTPPKGFEKIEPSSLQVTVKAAPFIARTIEGVPITLNNLGTDYSAKILTPPGGILSIPVEGTTDRVSGLTTKDIALVADLSGLGPGTHKLTLQLDLPRYVHLTDDASLTAEVEITAKDKPATTAPGTNKDKEPDQVQTEPDQTDGDASKGGTGGSGADGGTGSSNSGNNTDESNTNSTNAP
ncbi:hypothetical protein DCC85_19235 [Paenibacillus sp. CAA11]|uniref:CdaR family protein n=1 Tax=Paenibacillus sp. CAA11 TaxID=1532905 RepID=UPI000D3B6EFD|nr:CdaR family protein [Paenibacillus sp. CAA11]AWB46092.1 hypothetical protein DCC85_19235 [Paenibacillus sp. CAA11]